MKQVENKKKMSMSDILKYVTSQEFAMPEPMVSLMNDIPISMNPRQAYPKDLAGVTYSAPDPYKININRFPTQIPFNYRNNQMVLKDPTMSFITPSNTLLHELGHGLDIWDNSKTSEKTAEMRRRDIETKAGRAKSSLTFGDILDKYHDIVPQRPAKRTSSTGKVGI